MNYPVVEIRQPGTTVLWVIIRDRLIIGRDCDGILLRDDLTSRQHIELKLEAKNVTVTDLNSTNGTLLNGITLNKTKAFLMDDVIIIGHTEIRLVLLNSNSLSIPQATENLSTTTTIISKKIPAFNALDKSAIQDKEETVTIVFSDIESSTKRAAELGDQQWLSLLNQHDRIFKQMVNQFHGAIIKSQGDGFMLSFQSVRSAIYCMIAIQKALVSHSEKAPEKRLNIRIGIHTGEAIQTLDGDLFGRHVITAARISNNAKGGQILASSLVAQIAHGSVDINFGEGHQIAIKGLETLTVHEVFWRE